MRFIKNISGSNSAGQQLAAAPHTYAPYIPGILLFFISLVITLFTYKDYGVSWDEKEMRGLGILTYDYIFNGNHDLFITQIKHYGSGFELVLILIEKLLRLSDTRDIYLMRHLVTNIFFLVSALFMYALAYRLFTNKFIACLGFIMVAFAPRLYAHSFYNSRDLPFLSMFLVSLCLAQRAFERRKSISFFILGISCACTTDIRIMGVMLAVFILLFLLLDLFYDRKNRDRSKNTFLNILSFAIGFCGALYIIWPYLWPHPIANFIEGFNSFSRYPWNGTVLLDGKIINATNLPWTYFPIWFLISNPEVWLIAGSAGLMLVAFNFIKSPIRFLRNAMERNLLLALLCFFAPILSVILFHSILYTDWRHLYFVYPPFIIIALYFLHWLLQTKYRRIVQAICIVQVSMIGFFMVKYYPFSNVYFNNFVSHKDEYLRENYGMDLWGSSIKQGLDHILETDKSPKIKISGAFGLLIRNNIMLLPKDQRARVQYVPLQDADYGITCYNEVPGDFRPSKVDYTIKVLNSSVVSTYKMSENHNK